VGEDLGELGEEAVEHASQEILLASPIVHQAAVKGESAPQISPRAVGQASEGELAGPQQFSHHGRISIIVLGAAQILSLSVALQGERVDQAEAVASTIQEIGEVPPVVAGGLHSEQKVLSIDLVLQGLHLPQKPLKAPTGVREFEASYHSSP